MIYFLNQLYFEISFNMKLVQGFGGGGVVKEAFQKEDTIKNKSKVSDFNLKTLYFVNYIYMKFYVHYWYWKGPRLRSGLYFF